jgi:hypothetical protein
MDESFLKRTRKPIEWWGYEGEQMYNNFPQHGDKKRIVHNNE